MTDMFAVAPGLPYLMVAVLCLFVMVAAWATDTDRGDKIGRVFFVLFLVLGGISMAINLDIIG